MATAGAGLAINGLGATNNTPSLFNVNRLTGSSPRLKLSFAPYELKLRHAFTVAIYTRTTTPDVQVQVEYDGVIGYGEASMPPYLGESIDSVTAFLKKVDLSQFSDPFQLEDILAYVDGIAPDNTAAKASVDIALHDLVGKLLKAPWYKIWGLNKAKTPITDYTIGIDTDEVIKQKVQEVAGKFKALKIKVGTDRDKDLIKTIRSVTDLPLRVDANQGWTDKYKALDMINWFKEQGVIMVEQPMAKDNLEDIAWITERSPLPIYGDESVKRLKDIKRMVGVFNGINIKLMKCTGMREAMKMINLCRALGFKVMVGCMTETSCAVSAAAQLSPLVDLADLDGNLLIANDRFSGMKVVDGKVTLTDFPGVGIKKL